MTPFGLQTAHENTASLHSSVRQFEYFLIMGEVSLETSPKNVMIQDTINSENSMFAIISLLFDALCVCLFEGST